jgi:hypothetical protein
MSDVFDPKAFLAESQQPKDLTYDPKAFLAEGLKERFGDAPVSAAVLGALRGPTLGATDVLGAALGYKDEIAAIKEYNPTASLVGEIGGIIAPSLLTGGAGLVGAAARGAAAPASAIARAGAAVEGALAKQFVQSAAKSTARKVLESAAAKGAGSAVEGLAYGAGQVISEAALGDPRQVAENAVATLGVSSLLGGAFGAGSKIAGAVVKGTVDTLKPIAKNWTERLIGLDEETIRTINNKADKVQKLADLADSPDEAVLLNAKELSGQISAARQNLMSGLFRQSDEAVAPIANKSASAEALIDTLESTKKSISPNDIRISPEAAGSLGEVDDIITTVKSVGMNNLGIPKGPEAEALIKETTDAAFENFLLKREEFLTPKWDALRAATEKLKGDEQAVPLKPYLDLLKEKAKERGGAAVAVTGPAKQLQAEIQSLIADMTAVAKQNMGLPEGAKFAAKDLYLKGSQLVPFKRQFQDAAEYVYEIGKTSPLELAYKDLAALARKDLDKLSPEIGAINAELAKSIKASQQLKRFGLTQKTSDPDVLKQKFSSLLSLRDKQAGQFQKAIGEIDALYGTNLAGVRKTISPLLYAKDIPTKNLRLNATQLEEIRSQLVEKIAKIGPESKIYPGLSKAHDSIVSELESLGAKGISKTSKEQVDFLRTLNSLKRYGLDADEIDPTKLKDLLLTSTRRGEKDYDSLKKLGDYLGIDLSEAREVSKAFYEMHKSAPLSRLRTGASGVAPGGLGILGSFAGPVGAAAGFALGATLQNSKNLPKFINAMSRAQDKAGKMADSLAKFGADTSRFIPESTMPYISGKIAALMTLERQTQKVDRQINGAINGFFSPDAIEQKPTSFDLMKSTSFSKPYAKSFDDRVEAFNERLSEIIGAASDLNALNDRVAKNTYAINMVAPTVAQELSAKAIQAAEFLMSKAPKNPIMNPLQPHKTDWQPSDAELAKFERYVEAVENPLQVLSDLKAGIVTREQVETLKILYPGIYDKLSVGLREKAATSKKPMSYKQKNSLSILFQEPMTQLHKPQVLAMLQNGMNPEGQSQPNNSSVSKKMPLTKLTETQRIESGGTI